MGRRTQTDDATEELTAEQAYEEIAARLADTDGPTEVTQTELTALGVVEGDEFTDHRYVASPHQGGTPVVAQGSKDADPVDCHLVRVASDKWLNLKRLRKLIARDGGSKWVATDAGEVTVSGRPLHDGWRDGVADHDEETLAGFESAYVEESERCFDYVTEMLGAAYDGTTVYMEAEEPWLGWDRIAADLGVSSEEFEYEIRPAIASGRPRSPRVLDTDLTPEYAVGVEFESEVSD